MWEIIIEECLIFWAVWGPLALFEVAISHVSHMRAQAAAAKHDAAEYEKRRAEEEEIHQRRRAEEREDAEAISLLEHRLETERGKELAEYEHELALAAIDYENGLEEEFDEDGQTEEG